MRTWMGLGVLLMGCNASQPTPVNTPAGEVKTVVQKKVEPSSPEPLKAGIQREIVIGGCRDACAEPHESMVAFLQGCARQDAPGILPFLETSEMVMNGERLGTGWVQLWKSGALEQRRQEIARFAETLVAWGKAVEPEAFEVSLANQLNRSEDDGPGFLFHFRPPKGVAGPEELSEWRFRVQRRGWEWLVSEIRTKPE